jgi:hypothetical protein
MQGWKAGLCASTRLLDAHISKTSQLLRRKRVGLSTCKPRSIAIGVESGLKVSPRRHV